MSEHWTEENPGLGSTDSVARLASMLDSTSTLLAKGESDIRESLSIFPDEWEGVSARVAAPQIEETKTRVGVLSDATAAVKTALNAYTNEVDEIKSRANTQIFLRDAAQDTIKEISSNMLVITTDHFADLNRNLDLDAKLAAARAGREEAISSLKSLAQRRQKADEVVLESVRTVISEHWNLSPEAYPSDRSWEQQGSYEYTMDHSLAVSTDQYTAKELMDLFKKYPSEIFPFTVKGPDGGFQDGAVFELSKTLGFGWGVETGTVAVKTTDTSVKFTVVSDNYFDGPGSTIEFSIIEKDGEFYLRKVADAEKAQATVVAGVTFGANDTWKKQAENFQSIIKRYGSG
ncbi:hypothetical protein [Mycetocola lacteus]|uniref:hypothetical protein n=1 Tax=Mycetocola lacteus TaxID=76637 RepID=UPI0011C42AE2|nr:hypothetical protein [Mycetocola lacteus]